MKEGEATRKLKRALEEHPRLDAAHVQRHVEMYGGGIPDLSVSVGAFTLWIELKIEGRKLTKLQEYVIKRLGAGACVVTFSKDGKHAIVNDISMAGWLSFKELVEEIVSRCVDNEHVRGRGLPRGIQEALNSGDGVYRP